MVLSSRILGAIVVLVFAFALPTVAAALSPSYFIEGVEIAATSREGTFVGTGTGDPGGDEAVWQAVVDHEKLSSRCESSASGCVITGGTFSLVNQDVEAIDGTFSSGSIKLDSEAPGCGIQVFSVFGTLTDMTTAGATGGTGSFSVTLTHFRALYLGRCTTFFAKVSGNVSFTFTTP